jgi:hypothetical protein
VGLWKEGFQTSNLLVVQPEKVRHVYHFWVRLITPHSGNQWVLSLE